MISNQNQSTNNPITADDPWAGFAYWYNTSISLSGIGSSSAAIYGNGLNQIAITVSTIPMDNNGHALTTVTSADLQAVAGLCFYNSERQPLNFVDANTGKSIIYNDDAWRYTNKQNAYCRAASNNSVTSDIVESSKGTVTCTFYLEWDPAYTQSATTSQDIAAIVSYNGITDSTCVGDADAASIAITSLDQILYAPGDMAFVYFPEYNDDNDHMAGNWYLSIDKQYHPNNIIQDCTNPDCSQYFTIKGYDASGGPLKTYAQYTSQTAGKFLMNSTGSTSYCCSYIWEYAPKKPSSATVYLVGSGDDNTTTNLTVNQNANSICLSQSQHYYGSGWATQNVYQNDPGNIIFHDQFGNPGLFYFSIAPDPNNNGYLATALCGGNK